MSNSEHPKRQWEMEIEAELSNINKNVNKLTIAMEKHISLSEGLDLPSRMTKAEDNIEKMDKKKPAWSQIMGVLTAFSIVVGLIYTVARGGM